MTTDETVFVHPLGLCESEQVGAGTRVWAFAHVLRGADIGADCNICDHAFVEGGARLGRNVTVKNGVLVWEGVTIEDDVFLGPAMVFTNDYLPRAAIKKGHDQLLHTTVRRGATIGANATIVCGISIGEQAFIGAGTVVVDDVPAHSMTYGNPGRHRGWVCECAERLDETLACACGKSYELIDERAGLRRAL
jgi:UDP-2-acetamido-3-amino-2,3-dideoxy-glucuronate N-acetyltransferase